VPGFKPGASDKFLSSLSQFYPFPCLFSTPNLLDKPFYGRYLAKMENLQRENVKYITEIDKWKKFQNFDKVKNYEK
jgi:hypothetical protein